MMNLAFFHNLGLPELLIILVIVLLLFGHRLPGIGRAMGRSVSEFKDGYKGDEDQGKSDTSEGGDKT